MTEDHSAPPADVFGILRAFRGDRALLAKLVRNFIEDLPAAWEKVRRATASRWQETAQLMAALDAELERVAAFLRETAAMESEE